MMHDHSASRRRLPASAAALATWTLPASAEGTARRPALAEEPLFLIGRSSDTLIPRGQLPHAAICGGGRADGDPPFLHDRNPETMGEDFNWARPSDARMLA